jgi:ligand-binding SRPBCC domain-containing protein
MKTLKRIQILPISLPVAWEFFSDPKNLKKITPPYMGFDITSELPEGKMYQGMIITYKVSPFLGIPVDWVTEITHVQEPAFFVDNQKSGPFKYWHHQHIFKEIEGGVEMTDIVNYAAPVPVIGTWLEKLMIERRVNEIFDYRFKVLEKRFAEK